MGLDMFLTRKTYVGNKHREPAEMVDVILPKESKSVTFPIAHIIRKERISEISEEIGYWRKANAIHKWFVENIQNGEDDCKEYQVSYEQIEKLLKLCKKVLLFKSNAYKYLPTENGFFFGSTDYDNHYFNDIKHTKEICEEIINNPGGNIYYQSNW
jgi:hypothetical protein